MIKVDANATNANVWGWSHIMTLCWCILQISSRVPGCSETMSWRRVIHFFFVFSNKMVLRIHLPILLQRYLKDFYSESIFQESLFRIDFVWISPNIWTDSRQWVFCRPWWHWMMAWAISRPSVHLMASTIIGSNRESFILFGGNGLMGLPSGTDKISLSNEVVVYHYPLILSDYEW